MRIRSLYILFVLLLAVSCLDPYYPAVNDYIDLPVIEGMITNEPGPYTIRLTHSTAIQDMEIKPIRGATITIEDDQGTLEVLSQVSPGVYQTSPAGIQGTIGRSYRLTVESEGNIYQSDFELLREPVPIDSIYALPQSKPAIDGYLQGLQFFVNTGVIPDPQVNFLWTFTETYKFRSEFELDFIYYGIDSIVRNYSDSGLICWRTDKSIETFTWSANQMTQPTLQSFPLQFIDTRTVKISMRYSMLLLQYTISTSAFQYWNEVEKLHEETGSLYTRQPYQVKGNFINQTDPDAMVLGYFMTAGVTNRRIFIDKPSFDFNYNECIPVINLYQTTNPNLLKFPLFSMELGTGDEAFALHSCFDCRLKGGTITQPDFWEE